MKTLLIGSGNRAKAYAMFFTEDIIYVSDPDIKKCEKLIDVYNLKNAKAVSDYKDLNGFDSIIIAVPDYVHEEVFEWAVTTKKPILLEKPVAVTKKSLENIYKEGIEYKAPIVLGFGLRYTFMYTKIFDLLKNNAIGQVISVEAAETLNPIHAAKFFRRWHRFSEFSGGFLNTKCSHDMDIINLVTPGKPIYISSFGSNSIFSQEKGMDVCSKACSEFETCKFVDKNEYIFSTADACLCPYQVESDIVDHQVVSMEFDSGATVVFTVSMHSDKGNRHIHIHGTDGSIKASMTDQKVYLTKTGVKESQIFEPEEIKGDHGGGDYILCSQFADAVKNKKQINHLQEGILASVMALAADESRKTGTIVDLRIFADYMYNEK